MNSRTLGRITGTIVCVAAAHTSWGEMSEAWSNISQGQPSRLIQTSDGDLVVSSSTAAPGRATTLLYTDARIERYTPEGTLRWRWQSNDLADDTVHDLAADAQGNIYAVGKIGMSFWGVTPYHTWIKKFNPQGQIVWSAVLGGSNPVQDAEPVGVRTTHDGGVVVFGYQYGPPGQEFDAFIAKFGPGGNQLWHQVRGTAFQWEYASDAVIDAAGNCYWIGALVPSGAAQQVATVEKLSPSGQRVWTWQHVPPSGAKSGLNTVRFDLQGNVVAVGVVDMLAFAQDGLVVKLTPGGQEQWHREWDGPFAGHWDRYFDFAVLPDNSLAVTGDTYTSDGWEYYDVPVNRYSPQGDLLWSSVYNSTWGVPTSDTEDWSRNILAAPNGDTYSVCSDWVPPGIDYAVLHHDLDGRVIERFERNTPGISVKDVDFRMAALDLSRHALFVLGWGTVSGSLNDQHVLVRVNLSSPAPTCPADLDNGSGTGTPDGGVTIDDLLYYLTQFEAGSTNADLDDGSGTGTPDQGVTIDDLVYFLTRYQGGC